MKREIAGLVGLVGAWQVVKRVLEQRLGQSVPSEPSEDNTRPENSGSPPGNSDQNTINRSDESSVSPGEVRTEEPFYMDITPPDTSDLAKAANPAAGDDEGDFDDKEHFTSGTDYGGYEFTNVEWHTDPVLDPASFPHVQEEDDATNTNDVGF
jgi:hypothetical protein